MRIDSHGHGMHADRDADGMLRPPLRPVWAPQEQSPEQYVSRSVELGVEGVLVLDPPDIAFALKETFGDFVLAAPMVDPDATTPEEIDDLFQRGACGIKFIAPTRSYGDDAYLPLYDAVLANRGLAVFHTGFLLVGMFDPGGIFGRKSYMDIEHMRPAAIDRIGRAFPDLKILMAHFGNPWWEEAWKILSSHKNVYADFSGGTAVRRSMNMWREIFAPDGRLDTAAVAKLCFGSDTQYFVENAYDFPRYIHFYERFFEELGIPSELQEQVNRGNMRILTSRE